MKGVGRKKSLGIKESRKAYKLLMGKKYHSACAVANVLNKQLGPNSKLAPATIIRAAKSYAVSINKPIHCDKTHTPQQQLSKKAMENRVLFCKATSGMDWNTVMFTDRKQFVLRFPGCQVYPCRWMHKGDRRQAVRAVGKPIALNVYVGITAHGPTKCHFVVGTTGMKSKYKTKKGNISKGICGEEYKDVMVKTLLPEGDRIFGIGTSWVFQQDGDRSHSHGKENVEVYRLKKPKSKVVFLDGWPAHSPDLSPVENFWGWLQREINKHKISSVVGYKRTLIYLIKHAPAKLFASYYKSMLSRVQLCIDKSGARTRY
jgi:hypothetical protein